MKKTVRDIDVSGKKVLVRCDFNVPMKDGVITDENRIIGAVGDTVNIIWHTDTDKSYTENCEDIREVLTKLFEKSVEKYGIASIEEAKQIVLQYLKRR